MSSGLGNTQDYDANWPEELPGTAVLVTIPARLPALSVLGKAVREYCAALPYLLARHQPTDPSLPDRFRFGTGRLELPGDPTITVRAGYSHFVYSAELILQEAASNIIRHGYGGGKGQHFLQIRLGAANLDAPPRQAFLMELSDAAPPFDPTTALWQEPDPREPRESGYGIYLIRKLTDRVSYRYDGETGRNRLRMLKYINI